MLNNDHPVFRFFMFLTLYRTERIPYDVFLKLAIAVGTGANGDVGATADGGDGGVSGVEVVARGNCKKTKIES